jgi:proteasome beta subunit
MEKLKTGTTTLGLVCSDGLIVGADQKATMGNLVASKTTKKVYEISDGMVMTLAGSVGDAQAMVRLLRAEMNLYKLQEKEVTTKAAVTLLANILRGSYKSFIPELVQLLIGGYDKEGAKLYSLDAAGGVTEEKDYVFSGSGSVISLGVLEEGYKEGMTVEEGVRLIARSLRAARERDAFTGGKTIDIVIVNSSGIEWVSQNKIQKLLQ